MTQATNTEPKRWRWRRNKFLRAIDNRIRSVTCWIGIRTSKYECYPNNNKFLAGIHALTWNHWCGYGWHFSFRMAWIYWKPDFMRKP